MKNPSIAGIMMYKDRIDAGFKLAALLKKYKNQPGVVLAIPRGGVPLGFIIARELGFPMDILLTKKIGHPLNKEYAIGAVSLKDRFIVPHEDVPQSYIEKETEIVRSKLISMYTTFMGNRTPEPLKDKIVIVVDDGIATGNTLLSTVQMLRKEKPARIVIAVPVSSASAYERLKLQVDEIICPYIPQSFYGVGQFYENFEQVSDTEVKLYLDKLRTETNS